MNRSARLQLAGLLRRLGPAERIEADQIYRAVRAQSPRDRGAHWAHGLLLKHSGRFDEALDALAAYRAAGGTEDEAYRWNTGICATGAGKGAQALEVWRALSCKIELGDDGLPAGGFASIQVRISSRGPICDPTRVSLEGESEFDYGWAHRLSPCHGVLLTPLMLDEPADVRDLVLWDGAPVREKAFDGRKVATFPLLAVLRRGGYLRFPVSRRAARGRARGGAGRVVARPGRGSTSMTSRRSSFAGSAPCRARRRRTSTTGPLRAGS